MIVLVVLLMSIWKELFGKGRYHIYLIYATLIEAERHHFLPYTNLCKRVTKEARQELALTDPDNDHSQTTLSQLTQAQLQLLTTSTKAKVAEVQGLSSEDNDTQKYTAGILTLGAVTFFFNPSMTAIGVGGYLSVLTADLFKSVCVLKWGVKPAWESRTAHLAYLVAAALVATTVLGATKAGVKRLQESV